MDVAGNLLQSISSGIVGLVGGALGALRAALQGVIQAFQNVLPGPWLPLLILVVVALVVWSVVKR